MFAVVIAFQRSFPSCLVRGVSAKDVELHTFLDLHVGDIH